MVLVSAAIRPDSVPALALEKAFLDFDACVSRETLAELTTVLSRSKFDRHTPARQRDDFVAGFLARALVIEVATTVSDCVDPKDNVFLALAETAEADLIVSSDPHLTRLHPWQVFPYFRQPHSSWASAQFGSGVPGGRMGAAGGQGVLSCLSAAGRQAVGARVSDPCCLRSEFLPSLWSVRARGGSDYLL